MEMKFEQSIKHEDVGTLANRTMELEKSFSNGLKGPAVTAYGIVEQFTKQLAMARNQQ